MINTGKCPGCGNTVTSVNVEDVDVAVGLQPQWRGVSYVCPHCRIVLGVEIDPIALKSDIVSGVAKKLGR